MALRVSRDPHVGLVACCRYCHQLILGTQTSHRIVWTADTVVDSAWLRCPKHPTPEVLQSMHMPEEVDLDDPLDVEKWLGES